MTISGHRERAMTMRYAHSNEQTPWPVVATPDQFTA